MRKENKPFRVLTLDGGGMRGLYTASVLNALGQRFSPKQELDIGKGFNLIIGTSTGGILACGLAAGVPISNITDIYRKHGRQIFTHPLPRHQFAKFLWAICNLFFPANKNEPLHSSLENIFKKQTLGDLFSARKIGLCIPSIDLATHKSQVFKTAHDPRRNADDERQLVDICLATSAAPIMLPIASINNPHTKNQTSHFVDGGLWANNPVLVGLIEALHITNLDQAIEIVSIGTCPPPSGGTLLPKEIKRGIFGWNFGIKALELSMDAQASGHQFMAKFLVEHLRKCNRKIKLLRFEQSAPSSDQATHLGMDNPSERACSTLIELGNSDALKHYGQSLDSESEYSLLQPIFQSMPNLTTKEKK
jgi:uncharacterized protein